MTAPGGMRWEGNIFFGASSGLAGQSGVTERDPKLIRAGNGLWRPAPDSPVVGAAAGEFPAITADIDGQPRLAKRDVGCDQHSGAPVLHRPLTAGDVGPVWRK
jgi:hypothetical protein